MPPDVVCRITQSQTPPENTSVAPACWVRGLAARIQRYTTWERGLPARLQRYATWVRRRPARMPGARASSLPQRYAPPGCAGVQPACWERGRLARIQRYTPSPLHRLGARASSPHAGSAGFQPASAICPAWVRRRPARMPGAQASSPPTTPHLRARASSPPPAICHVGARASSPHAGGRGLSAHMPGARASSSHAGSAGVSPAYSDTPHHPCTAWVRGRRARMPGVQALRPHTAIHLITPAPPGCAGVAPACRVYRHCARIQRYTPSPLHRLGAQASRPHAGCTGIAPAYSDTPHHPCTAWVRGRLARMPRAEGHTWQWQWVLDQSLTS